MHNEEMVKSKNLRAALLIVAILLLVFVSFASGVAVGLRKAKFSYQWGQNYERNFMGGGFKSGGMMGGDGPEGVMTGRGGMLDFPRSIEGRDFRNAHGLAGTIISITANNIIVKDRDGKESTVAVTQKTIIKDHMADVKITDLEANDQIVVMGRPDDQGVISADLLRVFCCAGAVEENNSNNN